MSNDITTISPALPALRGESIVIPEQVAAAGDAATERFVEFFIATIRNPNTRRTYLRAVKRFFAWADQAELAVA